MKEKIKRIWGIAKASLGMTDDDLYALLHRETGKESMRDCTAKDLDRLLLSLRTMQGFSEQRGNRATKKQIWKIRQLEKQLDWDDNPKRLQGFLKRFYKVEQVEWLTSAQAWRAIESLKKLIDKEREQP